MEQKKINVIINNKMEEYPEGVTYLELALEHQDEKKYPIVLARADGRLRELGKRVKNGQKIEFLTVQEPAGFNSYCRSVVLLLLKAIYHVVGDNSNIERVGIHFAVSGGYYCTMQGKTALNQEFLDEVKAYMYELVEAAIPIEKFSEATYEARRRFGMHRMYDKEELFRYRRASKVNIYRLKNFEDYFYGYMVPNTSYLKYFDLKMFEDGFVLLLPAMETPEQVSKFVPEMNIYRVQKDSMEWGQKLGIPTVGALNSYIVNHKVKDLIMIQEAYHEKKIAEIAAQIAASPEKKIVLIAGPSSSGKTTFSHRLSTQLSVYGLKPHPIAADDYFIERDKTPLDKDGKPDFESLKAIDIELLNQNMLDLLAGKTVDLPTYNFKTGKREYKGRMKQLGKEDILVIEGIHCLNDALTYRLPKENKFKIYISALTQLNIDEHNRIPTTDGRLLRRIVRDARTRGTSAKETIDMWPSVRRGEESYIFPNQEQADVMINSALIYELAVLKVYAEPLLFEIRREDPEYDEAKRLLKFLDYFVGIPSENIPINSLLREFVGGSCFHV